MERGRRTWGRREGKRKGKKGRKEKWGVVGACIALAFSLLCTARCMYDSDGGLFLAITLLMDARNKTTMPG